MDFGQALTYQFRDPHWMKKFLVAALLSLIPLLGPVMVLGWALGITRRMMIDQADALLPELEPVEDLWRGLKAWGFGLIYALPATIIAVPFGGGLLLLLAAESALDGAAWALAGLCLVALLIAYSLVYALVLPAAYGCYLAGGESFRAGLRLRQIFGLLRREPAAYFLVMIGGLLCFFITLFGMVGCMVGIIFSGLYTQTVMAHLFGQAYRAANRRAYS